MSRTNTSRRNESIALGVTSALVALHVIIAAGHESLSMSAILAQSNAVWIPGPPLWLVHAVTGMEGGGLGQILPGLVHPSIGGIMLLAAGLLVVQCAAFRLALALGRLGDLAVKAVVMARAPSIQWLRADASDPPQVQS